MSLKTTVWTTAKLRLADLQKNNAKTATRFEPPKFSEAVEMFKQELEHDTTLKPQRIKYRLWCLGKLQKSWPELWVLRINEITSQACKEWS